MEVSTIHIDRREDLYLTLELKDAVLYTGLSVSNMCGVRELTISASEVGGHPGT
jgi:hypothetical protein